MNIEAPPTPEIAMPQFCTSWARLYALLSDAFPEERIRRGVALVGFEQEAATTRMAFRRGRSSRSSSPPFAKMPRHSSVRAEVVQYLCGAVELPA